jgi:hypothetical protein
MTPRLAAVISLSIAVILTEAACGTGPITSSGEASRGGGASATAGTPSPPDPVSAPPDPLPCRSRHVSVGEATPSSPVCLRVGEDLQISVPSSPTQPWQPVTSSDPRVLDCHPGTAGQGTTTVICTAHRPGTAVVSTTTGPFNGDPHGPAQHEWQLTVTVTA